MERQEPHATNLILIEHNVVRETGIVDPGDLLTRLDGHTLGNKSQLDYTAVPFLPELRSPRNTTPSPLSPPLFGLWAPGSVGKLDLENV